MPLRKSSKKQSEQGMTMLEVLAAIVMTTVLIMAMTPPLLIAMGTRIQARRAEQAMNIARQELERVRLIVESGEYQTNQLPPQAAVTPATIADFPAPGPLLCTNPCTDPAKAFKVSVGNDDYFFVQTFREPGVTVEGVGPNKSDQIVAFRMGVRVYGKTAKLGSLTTEKGVVGLSSNQKAQTTTPLVVLYTDLIRSDLDGGKVVGTGADFSGSLGAYHMLVE